jgi:hypothetical protein
MMSEDGLGHMNYLNDILKILDIWLYCRHTLITRECL